jgi:hypothetical protein
MIEKVQEKRQSDRFKIPKAKGWARRPQTQDSRLLDLIKPAEDGDITFRQRAVPIAELIRYKIDSCGRSKINGQEPKNFFKP